jgi:methionyl aminopeptidase
MIGSLREAGRIAAAAREAGARMIVAGARVLDVCAAVEDEIVRRGGRPAFPAQSSRNEVAAHYCPPPGDETRYTDGDLAKLDLGVHVDGYVVDTAASVSVGGHPEAQRLIDATEAALAAAIAVAGAGVPIERLSAAIEAAIRSHGARPVRNIGGHGVGRWTVHCPPPIPNVPESRSQLLVDGGTIAVEPFATHGSGLVAERGRAEVFRFDPRHPGDNGVLPGILDALRALRGLPFSRRQLAAFPLAAVDEALKVRAVVGALQAYAPLVELSGKPVAQTEHTLLIRENGVEVLTA